ncbi:hypothetical protein GR138_12880 [Shinella kummerowiae]|uniref:Uncharacterized protein n=1 Tax=Shinella kummerowiae TaxID=417745 RepID=A0A6N8SAI6_9HYPH|nr:hypothetical protein [Shinella kummerowiae]MXN46085.1 hypothetical protein [Shinella kummerowiae]
MTSPQEALQKARELISDPKRWTQEAYARDTDGVDNVNCGSDHIPEDSVCFCSIGAIAKAYGCNISAAECSTAFKLLEAGLDDEVGVYNDSHTHAEVLAAFDLAIARASSSEEKP